MTVKKYLYVVGMRFIGNMNSFTPEAICGSQIAAEKWIKDKMEGYKYNGLGYYAIMEIPFVG